MSRPAYGGVMSTIAIVGGHGKIARQLIALLAERGDLPVALVRDPDHAADLPGAAIRLLDLESASASDFETALTGCDAVVFAAGGGPDGNIERKRTVDLEGSLKSIKAAQSLGITRFVQVSAMGVDRDPDESLGEVWTAYVHAKRDADAALRESGLDWTIIRPGSLTDDPGTGLVELADQTKRGEVPRADVAAVLAAALVDDRTIGRQYNLIAGDRPVAEALAST